MSYKFGKKSLERLSTCNGLLQEILNEAINIMDFTVLWGHRDKEEQNKAFRDGNSKVKFPNSKHNSIIGKQKIKNYI